MAKEYWQEDQAFYAFVGKNSSPLLLANMIKAEIKQKEEREVAIMPALANGGRWGAGGVEPIPFTGKNPGLLQ